jgi:hypothetical protein
MVAFALKIFNTKQEDNITFDVKEIGSEGMGWIHLAQDKFQ